MGVHHRKKIKLSLIFSIQNFELINKLKISSMKNLVLKKEKSVAFYTKHIFTAGHTSSQRLEILNSLINGFGSLKKDMVQWNLSTNDRVRSMCRTNLHKKFS